MFSGGDKAVKLKDEFRQHFRNISRIMDCVGCDKCKLWGKLQVYFELVLKFVCMLVMLVILDFLFRCKAWERL